MGIIASMRDDVNDSIGVSEPPHNGMGGFILTKNQICTILHLFELGPDYVYSIAKKTHIRQPTLQNIVGRLEEQALIRLVSKEEGEKGVSRKNYSLTSRGWCTAVMFLLENRGFNTNAVRRALDSGMERYNEAFAEDFASPDAIGVSKFLKHWKLIIQTAEAYPAPPDFTVDTDFSQNVFFKEIPELFVQKTDRCWLWYAALYFACRHAVIMSLSRGVNVSGIIIDVFFSSYLTTGGRAHVALSMRGPPTWVPYCCAILQANDELSAYTVSVLSMLLDSLEKMRKTYEAATDFLKKEEI